ncbi:MAG: phenylalanine--tRNA ligase subunit beta, partial [Candidatus Micrarchaeota archaeon]|nr:phenylalanine--tRNA ligase subunit beta [Candidatus Micrarchaeota archaeon]
LEITPNRLDLLDGVGFSRTVKNFMHKSKKYVYRLQDDVPKFSILVEPSVKKVRPFISGLVAQGLTLSGSDLVNLINFSEKFCETYGRGRRKIAIGMHNFDKLKTPLVYRSGSDEDFVALGNEASMKYSKILESTEKGKQYSQILKSDKVCYYPELIDSEGPIAFIPILNSERTKITTATKNIFVDITGTSEYAVNKTADLLTATFMDMGAEVKKVRINYGKTQMDTPELAERYVVVPLTRIEREIGAVIGFNNVISLANKMGYEAALVGNNIRFRVPEYRLDIIGEQDVIEDVAIAYGYEYIRPAPIFYSQRGGLEGSTLFNRKAAEVAIGLGFTEFSNSYLTNEEVNFNKMGLHRDDGAVALKNAKTEAISMMRTWLLPSLLGNLSLSTKEKLPQNVFELDLVFAVKDSSVNEAYHIAGVSIDTKANFNDMKAAVEGFLKALGIEHAVTELNHKSFIPGRCAEIKAGSKRIGMFGELHPLVLKNFGIEEPGTAFEMDLSTLE